MRELFFLLLLSVVCPFRAQSASSENRTVIFFYYESQPSEDVFARGGLNADTHEDCTEDVATDMCAIPIHTHLLGTIDHYDKYNAWRVGDDHLDWHGAERGQGYYVGQIAQGTPMAWTTNNLLSPGYQQLNEFGDHYWMVDMEMDCSSTDGGWFEVKAFVSGSSGWEYDVNQSECGGTIGGTSPTPSTNHKGLCGAINIFTVGLSDCIINAFQE